MASKESRLDISKPLYPQDTFYGRFRHFLFVTDPRSSLVPDDELYAAKELIEKYKKGQEPPGTTKEQLIYAKKLFESAFHPDTGELQNVFGRMSFQVPGGMAITGAMLQFYRTAPAVIFWQFVNQTFNAVVNYTNRNANSPVTTTQLGVAYVSATTSALVASLGSKSFLEKRVSPFFLRYVPFIAVAAANCVNIPLMRQNELLHGIDVEDENGKIVGKSRLASAVGITQVTVSRICMAAPGMLLLPVLMERLEKRVWFSRMKALHAPFQVFMAGAFLIFMVPAACSIFPQRASLEISTIKRVEPEFNAETKNGKVFFNKGL